MELFLTTTYTQRVRLSVHSRTTKEISSSALEREEEESMKGRRRC